MSRFINIKNRFLKLIQSENWFTHSISLATTILGILIALALDQYKEQRSEAKKIELYRIRLNNELKNNKQQIILDKHSLLRAHAIIEISRTYTATESGDYLIPKKLVDSLLTIDMGFKDLLTIHKEDADMLFVDFDLSFKPCVLSFDSWEAMKASNVLQSLNPTEVFHYSSVYSILKINLGKTGQEFLKRTEDMKADDQITETEKKEMLESIKLLIFDANKKESAIETCLQQLKATKSMERELEIDEPIDTTAIAERIKLIN
jgi:hypothetical protein